MDMKVVRELLENPDVRQIFEEQIAKAVEQKTSELDTEKASLIEQKKSAEKQLFIMKKTVLAKSTLYEKKLKEYYGAKFEEAQKKVAKEVYEFINESVKNLSSAIQEEVSTTSPSAQIQEAFAKAVKIMAPYVNVNELVETNQAVISELQGKVNNLIKTNKELSEKAVKADIHELVVSECADYPVTKQAIILRTVNKLAPKTLVEAKEAIIASKEALRKKEEELIEARKVAIEESVAAPETVSAPTTDRVKLKVLAEEVKRKQPIVPSLEPVSALSYDLYLGE